MGGAINQPLTDMPRSEHVDLHNELNKHLEKYQNANGDSMRPKCNNNGPKIRRNFSLPERVQALRDFYGGPGARFVDAAADFFKQMGSGLR